MIKGSVGGPLALLAAIATTVAAFLPFWKGERPYELAIRGLWQGYAGLNPATFLTSLALILVIGGVILLASGVAGSQALSFLGCAWVTALLVLFVRENRGPVSVGDFLLDEVDYGFWIVAGAAALALFAGFIPRTVKDEFRR